MPAETHGPARGNSHFCEDEEMVARMIEEKRRRSFFAVSHFDWLCLKFTEHG
ncbi:hypothetical protein EYZ11_004987 [Aspergillus tanneri]|uniref:Uncharacterized protein n=1 Tax=Aspergillus tanneri TaxID=1220188 RepID=A0A4S3JJN4_9EURO|nr:hypothetical protein EYZ11_004987 [Aspergillus tanneri]